MATTDKLAGNPDCPKCGGPDPQRTWLSAEKAAEPTDVIQCVCRGCGYIWRLLPKDAV